MPSAEGIEPRPSCTAERGDNLPPIKYTFTFFNVSIETTREMTSIVCQLTWCDLDGEGALPGTARPLPVNGADPQEGMLSPLFPPGIAPTNTNFQHNIFHTKNHDKSVQTNFNTKIPTLITEVKFHTNFKQFFDTNFQDIFFQTNTSTRGTLATLVTMRRRCCTHFSITKDLFQCHVFFPHVSE